MLGLVIEGVGGIPMLNPLLFPGVLSVKPMLPNFLLGGVGGLTNTGEEGADVRSVGTAFGAFAKGAVIMARPRLYADAVFTAKPFIFRPFFAGVEGRCCILKKSEAEDSVIARCGG